MSFRLWLRMIARELRGAPLRALFFIGCLSVAVAALTAVASVGAAVERGLRSHARELLGGDLSVEARRPLPDLDAALTPAQRSAPRVAIALLATMVRSDRGRSRLVEVKAIDASRGRYPLAGALSLEPARPLSALLDDHSVLVARELLQSLSLQIGDSLRVGSARFRIAGLVLHEPDARDFAFTLGPRVLMTRRALDASGLLGFGSRVLHRAVIALPSLSEAQLSRLKETLSEQLPGAGAHVSIETRYEAQPALRTTFARVQPFLGLVALLSLLVAGLGIAQIVAAWLAQSVRDTAVLRCLGVSPAQLIVLYLGHVLALATMGSALGTLMGALAPWWMAHAQPTFLPPGVLGPSSWSAVVLPALLGIVVPLLFSLPALLAVHRVSPGRVLRAEAEPLPIPRALQIGAGVAALGGLFGAAWVQTRQLELALPFGLGAAVLAWLLWSAARATTLVVGKLHGARVPAWLWHGAAALRRPGSAAIGGMVALGLGTTIVVALQLSEQALQRDLAEALPARAPSLFLLDVQPDQWQGLASLARRAGATHADSVPVAMARLTAIDGSGVDRLVKARPGNPNERQRTHWVLTREQRLSWAATLPADNRIVEGALWSRPHVNEVSVEAGFARDLGARVGSVLRFDLQGVPIELTVTSLRTIEWRSFAANFFLIVEPGVLDAAPHTRLGVLHIAPSREQALQDQLAVAYPNVTVLRVRELAERAGAVISQISLAVRVLGGCALLTGIAILVGGVAATGARRLREAALLRALGVRRRHVIALIAVEYGLRGLVAGLIGSAGAYALATACGLYVLELQTFPSWSTCLYAALAVTTLSMLGGMLASTRAMFAAPIRVLRRPL